MPAKALCPDCGMKARGTSHLCDPMKVIKTQKRKAALAKVEG